MVAIPAYNHSVHCDTMAALMSEQLHALGRGWLMEVVPVCGHSMLPYARNLLAAKFLEENYTDLVFIDSDTSWKSPALCDTLANMDRGADIVGGAVPVRMEPIQYRVRWKNDSEELWADEKTGFLEVEAVGTAFLCIKRNVLEALCNESNEYFENDLKDKKAWEFFSFERLPADEKERALGINFRIWGEDMNFCRKAKEAGFKIWLAPEIEFCHFGNKKYMGSIGEYLRNR